jgi:hypothetical protein
MVMILVGVVLDSGMDVVEVEKEGGGKFVVVLSFAHRNRRSKVDNSFGSGFGGGFK